MTNQNQSQVVKEIQESIPQQAHSFETLRVAAVIADAAQTRPDLVGLLFSYLHDQLMFSKLLKEH